MRIGRRNFLGGAASAGLLHAMAGQGVAATRKTSTKIAPYGAAIYLPDLTADSRIGEAVVKYCSRITPVTEMKWEVMRPSADVFDFAAADALANFARQNKLTMHGHPLIWYASNAPWLASIGSGAKVEKLMETHIVKVMERYKDVIHSWDVVNEPIPDVPGNVRSRRDAWYYGAGPDAIKKAFDIAHSVDPKAQLVLNEYDVEFAVEKSPAKRAAFRNLILELLEKGAPINAIGLQGHLRGGWPIAKDELAAFTKEMRSYGLASGDGTGCDGPDASRPGSRARHADKRSGPRFSRSGVRRRPAFLHHHMGHFGPIYLDSLGLSPPGWHREPAAAARLELQRKTHDGRHQ